MYLHFKNNNMKTSTIKTGILSLLAVLFIGTVSFAQYDDLYYEASDDVYFADIAEEEYVEENHDNVGYSSFDEDDGYYYSSRIRRFSRPSRSISYFSPLYTNSFNYGASNIGYNSLYSPTGAILRNNAFGYSSLSSPFSPVSTFGRTTGFNTIGGYGGNGLGFSNAYYCPPIGGNFATTRTTNATTATRAGSTVSSSRRSGTVSSSTPRTSTTRTARTSRDYRGTSTRTNNVRTSTRTSSTNRSNSSSFRNSPRSSSVRSTPSRSTSTRTSSSVRSSSRSSRG